MKKSLTISLLLLLLMATTAAIFYTKLPYYQFMLAIAGIAMLVMPLFKGKFVFLLAMIGILGVGAFFTIDAFVNTVNNGVQVSYMYLHLLMTAFFLLYWMVLTYVQAISLDNKALRERVQRLEKYDPVVKVLTTHEFVDQAKIIYSGTSRRQENLCLLRLNIDSKSARTKLTITEKLGEIALQSIRKDFDLVTHTDSALYLLLQNPKENGVQIVQERFKQKARSIFNHVQFPFSFQELPITEVSQIEQSIKGAR
ncbi:hypothetical protein A374_19225 [Fictibacillus macauensis ZFHKF-1]|uniref:GGDEF domain-containing protein n=1 Tax=Fictibacillus macauensis ZFHKF-1 TaxID=1196324 RepID=I8UA67_9BACL|nr:hypothetical protein [Fictibacillus macauensis]EIT83683.1 hypothetical protein A374_19225 [Fictibacillus macauensis ZFHKF-1]